MKRIWIFLLLLLFIQLVFMGCVEKKVYQVDKKRLEQQKIFHSSQEPSFTLKLSEGLEYYKTLGKTEEVEKPGIRYTLNQHRFFAQEPLYDYRVVVTFQTLYEGEWGHSDPGVISPGKEKHGNKIFHCGVNTNPEKIDADRPNFEVYSTYKTWVYTPSSLNGHGKTRVIVQYWEPRDQTDDLEAFLERSDKHVNFTMD